MIKGLIVDVWHNGMKSPSQIDGFLQFARDCGMTDIYVQVRRRGDAYYNSQYAPKPTKENGQPIFVPANFDPLAYVIANKGELKIHAYLTMLQIGNPAAFTTFPVPGSWVMSDEVQCAWIDPTNEEARIYLRNIVKEVVQNYDVDGILLEKLRYPNPRIGSGTVPEKKEAIKALIENISADVRIINETLPIALCVHGNGTTYQTNVAHDLVDWRELSSRGVIDKAAVMVFKTIAKENEFDTWIDILDPQKEILVIGSCNIPLVKTQLRKNKASNIDTLFYSYANLSSDTADTKESFQAIVCQ